MQEEGKQEEEWLRLPTLPGCDEGDEVKVLRLSPHDLFSAGRAVPMVWLLRPQLHEPNYSTKPSVVDALRTSLLEVVTKFYPFLCATVAVQTLSSL